MRNLYGNRLAAVCGNAYVLMCIFLASPSFATDKDTYLVRYGIFLPAMDTSMRVDSDTLGTGDKFDLEDDIGFKKNIDLNRFELSFRFFEHHRIQVAQYKFSRSASRVINRDIQVADQIFTINASLNSQINNTLTELGYLYSFLENKQSETSVTIGVHHMDSEFQFSTTSGGGASISPKLSGPLPLVGLEYRRSFSKKIVAYAQAKFYVLEYQGFSGSLRDYRLSGEYLFTPAFGVGAGYHFFKMDLGLDQSAYDGKLYWEYKGAQVYAVLHF